MTHKTDRIVEVLHALIAMFPEHADDGAWMAAEVSEQFGIDPKDAKRVYDKRFAIAGAC